MVCKPQTLISFIMVLEIVAFDKNGLRMVFAVERLMDTPQTTVVHVTSTNQTQSPFTEFLFQAAVPKVSGHDI